MKRSNLINNETVQLLSEVRETAIQTVLRLHADGDFKDIIEDYSIMYVASLIS
jgi:hypothetical protein